MAATYGGGGRRKYLPKDSNGGGETEEEEVEVVAPHDDTGLDGCGSLDADTDAGADSLDAFNNSAARHQHHLPQMTQPGVSSAYGGAYQHSPGAPPTSP